VTLLSYRHAYSKRSSSSRSMDLQLEVQ